jgi:UDP-N-acetylglucosamine--N-acetylmuramyl-(pentapeptide) pyrophosphoryl-undecaprenol N-acetylglucosamine transferase
MSRLAATKTLVFAGGGTGGHVFPMIAVAEAVRALAPEVRAVFVGTARGLEARVVPARGYELELMRILPLRGGGAAGFVRGVWRAAGSLPEARGLVKRLQPAAVLSVGGYAAGPVALAGWSLGVPLALLEPNSVMGLANRLVAPLARRGYVAFEAAERHFRRGRVQRVGVPLRPGFEPVPYAPASGPLRLLVLGGSQGAKALNEAVPRAVARLGAAVEVVHQCGPAHAAAVTTLYKELGVAERARVIPFIDDMPAALAACELVIGRAGAGALSEICAIGRPSLLVPYPFAADDHQRVNAEAVARQGAAVCVDNTAATPERLAAEVQKLAADRGQLARMALQAQAFGRPDAAQRIALDLLSLAGLSDGLGVREFRAATARIPPSAAGFCARGAV